MTSSKLNVDGILLLEQPFIRVGFELVPSSYISHLSKVPYENYRKVFRTSQKNIERELVPIQTTCNELVKQAKAPQIDPAEASKSLESMIGRVENLKRKVSCSGNVFVFPFCDDIEF
jgi:macrophage erythroblast attacher